MLSIDFVLLPIFQGRYVLCAVEDLGKVAEGGETQKLGDLGHGQIGFSQQVFALFQTSRDHVIDGGDSVFPLEGMGKVEFVHVCLFCQLIQREGFLEMMVDIPADSSTLVVAHGVLGFSGHRKSGAAHEADDQNFHKSLANILITRLLQLHLTQDIAQTRGNVHTFKMVKDAELAVGILGDGKFHAFDTKNDVFQRLSVEGNLRVGDIGIDDDQVIGIDRVELILDEELALAAYNIKQFRVIVGVGHGMPVAAVFCTGGI